MLESALEPVVVVFTLLMSEPNCRLARIVPPLVSQASPSSSSSARLANTSGSSSSGGKVDIQHMRVGSKIMFPTIRAPDAKEPTGEPIEEPVRWVIRAGRVDEPTAESKSRSTWSFPSQRSVRGFHFMSPTTFGPLAPPKFRIRVGFFRACGDGVARDFFFELEDFGLEGFEGNSIRVVVRLSVLVEGARAVIALGSVLPLEPSRRPFFRTVPFSADFDDEKVAPGIRLPYPLG